MKENYLDSRSPYIKNSIYGIEKTRKNLISFSSDDKNSSDMLLRQKITNISKKIVGEEIKKFAEIASKEISEEFASLEKRVVSDVSMSLDEKIENKISRFGYDIGKELDNKIKELNSIISEIDVKLNDLELSSKSFNEKIEEFMKNKNILHNNTNEFEEPVFKLNLNKKEELEKKEEKKENSLIKEEELNIFNNENSLEKIEKYDPSQEKSNILNDEESEKEEDYIDRNMQELISKFERNGFLFKKNTFSSYLKDLPVKEFLNKGSEYVNIDKKDRTILEEILNDTLKKTNITLKEDETIEEFLKRVYTFNYYNK